MKVLDVTEFYSERGGGVRSHLTLKGHVLCQLGHDHVVVAPGAQDGETELARGPGSARIVRVKGPTTPYDPSYHLFINTSKIRDLIATERPDVLEIHSPYMAAAGALRAKPGTYGTRTFQWHSDFIDTYGGVLEAKAPFLPKSAIATVTSPLWSLVRSIARRCDATLVASAWQVGKLAAHGVPNVVHRPFGIEHDVFRADRASPEGRRELLELARGGASKLEPDGATFVFVGVGRFAIEKRWDLVIDAFKTVRARDGFHNSVLILFGDGPERERMKERAGDAPVFMPGFSKDRIALATHLANADMLVHGCPFETFGLSIAEAMSCGLPAVVPDDGGASEMHDPESGERYTANDAHACSESIVRLKARIDLNRRGLRSSAASAAAKLPSVIDHFSEQIELYTTLLDRPVSSK